MLAGRRRRRLQPRRRVQHHRLRCHPRPQPQRRGRSRGPDPRTRPTPTAIDDDHDGYVDDISGWDFLYGDNDPLDTVDYGHGTGEAKDSTAAANGTGDVGTCPGCLFIPVRVGDSFIADGGRFAAGVLFGLDSGRRCDPGGARRGLNDPRQAQEAIDAAYHRGVVVVASMADEASKHPNLPASLEHTMDVNSVTTLTSNPLGGGTTTGYLALNGCTNFGGHTFVSVPSSSCSSEATGRVGRHGRVDRELRPRSSTSRRTPRSRRGSPATTCCPPTRPCRSCARPPTTSTSPRRTRSIRPTTSARPTAARSSTPCATRPPRVGRHVRLRPRQRLRDAEGAARRAHPARGDDRQPVVVRRAADLGTATVTGRVAAPRARSYDYRVEWAPGLEPPLYPATDHWTVAATHTGLTAPLSGTLATLDLASIAASLPDGGTGAPVDPTDQNRPDEERFSVRIRVVVTAHGGAGDGLQGEMQKQVFVHDDPDLVAGVRR